MKPKMINVILVLLATAIFAMACTAQTELSVEEREELLRLTLEQALIEQEIPDYGLLPDPDNVVLSSANVDAASLPEELDGTNMIVMTPEEIQARANAEGDFLYLRFDEIEVKSANRVIVRLNNTWAVAEGTDTGYLSGGGFAVEYTRRGGTWSSEIVQRWIS